MTIQEHIPLAPYTTLRVGGSARWFAECTTEEELREALSFAREQKFSLAILGGGSNTLVPDEGFDGLVLHIAIPGITIEIVEDGAIYVSGAGVEWDAVVRRAAEDSLWGIENLAGVPGSMGGAAVQNIGAYGAELSHTFLWAEVLDVSTGVLERITHTEAVFEYRSSIFKQNRNYIVLRVALMLSKNAAPNLSYLDVALLEQEGKVLATPELIGQAVREIRARKFPQTENTAGSFFKNPFVTPRVAEALGEKFPGLPTFPATAGLVKIPLAWLLDHVLHLKGYAVGPVRLFERQPLVLVASAGARADDIENFAENIVRRVFEMTEIKIEREVEKLSAR